MTGIEVSKPIARLCRWALRAALLGFALSALVHVTCFFAPITLDAALPLHFGAIILGVPMVVVASVTNPQGAGFSWRLLLRAAAPRVRYAAAGLGLYGALNVLLLWSQHIPDLQGLSAVWLFAYASIALVYHAVEKQAVA